MHNNSNTASQGTSFDTPRSKVPTIMESLEIDLNSIASHLDALNNRATNLADRILGGEPRDVGNGLKPAAGTALGAVSLKVDSLRTLLHELESQMTRLERIA